MGYPSIYVAVENILLYDRVYSLIDIIKFELVHRHCDLAVYTDYSDLNVDADQ